MADLYYVYEDEHDGQGWFRPLGDIKMTKEEANDFIISQRYASLADQIKLEIPYPDVDFKLIKARSD